jgi:hydroxymethylpyrimidine/phosphomethylpyrimidine kinase
MNKSRNVPCVLVFAGLDPSGGAGIQADIQAISAAGVHALPVVTALTVQNNQRVMSVHPVDSALIREQCQVLIDQGTRINAIKIGIVGQADNAQVIGDVIDQLRAMHPLLPVVLDPVLASGHGDLLTKGDAVRALAPLLKRATLITPNLPEAQQLAGSDDMAIQATYLLQDAPHVLIKGGHGAGDIVINTWFHLKEKREWQWPRLSGEFHGSGCTLAAAIAAKLAHGMPIHAALAAAQRYTQQCLDTAFSIADGQWIPNRTKEMS